MRIKQMIWIVAIVLASAVLVSAKSNVELARQAVSEDHVAATAAMRALRVSGTTGLNALLTQYSTEIKTFSETGEATDEWKRIAYALDTVAMQKDAYASGLYWYTDLELAKRAAKEQDKPILSLRLLGNLNEEFSCANSRLFRSVLYPNAQISKFLRDNYILHWKSVRPAPRITIDFGDGRKIERTVTGNSIHYVLDDDGAIIEALPGLYSPKGFLIYLTQGKQIHDRVSNVGDAAKRRALMRYRKMSFDRISTRREKVFGLAKINLIEPGGTVAILAAPVAATKMMVTDEITLLRVYDNFARFEPQIDFSVWDNLAKVYSPTQDLDANSIAFIRRQNRKTGLSDAEFRKLISRLESFIALDTTRNDFLFHTKLYEWLNNDPTVDVDLFNARVYADVFKTPDSDRWLGLYSNDVYTALDGNGIIK